MPHRVRPVTPTPDGDAEHEEHGHRDHEREPGTEGRQRRPTFVGPAGPGFANQIGSAQLRYALFAAKPTLRADLLSKLRELVNSRYI